MTYLPPTHSAPFEPQAAPGAIERGLAYLGYGLLFVSAAFAGVTAFMALILAYARRDGAGPLMRSHWAFQIRIFWIAFALTLAGGAIGVSAAMDLARQWPPPIQGEPAPAPDGQPGMLIPVADPILDRTAPIPAEVRTWSYHFHSGALHPGRGAMLKGGLALALVVAATLWTVIASLFGALRLASGRPIGDRRISESPH